MMNALTTEPVEGNTILYFEDEAALAKLTSKALSSRGHSVVWYDKFPDSGISELTSRIPSPPDLVLLDIGIPNIDGYQICRTLRAEYLDDRTPIIFTSGSRSADEILHAYEAGGSDYLAKPLCMEEMVIKLEKAMVSASSAQEMDKQLRNARTLVFDTMSTSSELGNILRFLESSFQVKSYSELSDLLLSTVSEFGVNGSVMLFGKNNQHYSSSDGRHYPLEKEVFYAAQNRGRIIDVGRNTLFNFPTVSLLIKNMPKQDKVRYGHLKDQFCLLLNGVDERIKSMELEIISAQQNENIQIIANVIGQMVVDMENSSVQLSTDFEGTIMDLECDINSDLIRFNLLEEEEESLLGHVRKTIVKATSLFDRSVNLETQYSKIMQELLEDLNSDLPNCLESVKKAKRTVIKNV